VAKVIEGVKRDTVLTDSKKWVMEASNVPSGGARGVHEQGRAACLLVARGIGFVPWRRDEGERVNEQRGRDSVCVYETRERRGGVATS